MLCSVWAIVLFAGAQARRSVHNASILTSCAFGDFDRDGFIDIALGALDGQNRIESPATGRELWALQSGLATRGIAAGDVDSDGDIDLVCGNDGQPNTYYSNDGTTLEEEPSWQSALEQRTYGVALEDIDGDGDLDLVCANHNQFSTLYLNENRVFSAVPVWSSSIADPTTSLAIGDIDGNGYPDLVCGNDGTGNTLYLNRNGIFDIFPAWRSPAARTQSVALGDVDGDGDFDLVCGNFGESDALYLNQDGTFSTQPVWISTVAAQTTSVALWDVNGDGRLDLTCGISDGPNAGKVLVHLNVGGCPPAPSSPGCFFTAWSFDAPAPVHSVGYADVSDAEPFDVVATHNDYSVFNRPGIVLREYWSPLTVEPTADVVVADVTGDGFNDILEVGLLDGRVYPGKADGNALVPSARFGTRVAGFTSIAAGDVDLDGDVDVVVGRPGANALLLNEAGVLPQESFWQSGPAELTNDVCLADLDRDGYLDLVCANSGRNHLYRNVYSRNLGIVFEEDPSWSAEVSRDSRAVAVADLNGDGFGDLIFANRLAGNTVYLSDSTGAFLKGDLVSEPALGIDVAVADWDRDGDVDVGFAQSQSQNVVYLNTNGNLSFGFAFGHYQQATTAIAFSDVDRDEYPDILTGGENDPIELLLNRGTSEAPLWPSTDSVSTTFALAVDLNADGQGDFLIGRKDGATTAWVVHTAVRHMQPRPPIANQLTHQDATSDYLALESLRYNVYGLRFNLVDVESDSCWVTLFYKPAAGGSLGWMPIVPNIGLVTAGPLASSPLGVEHVLEWDVSRLGAPGHDLDALLRIDERTGVVHGLSHRQEFLGFVPVEGAGIEMQGVVAIPTVTIGDRASTSVTIRNRGNETLAVTRIDFEQVEPELGLELNPVPPFEIAPNEQVNLGVTLASRVADTREVPLLIESNDRAAPKLVADLRMQVLPLEADITFPEVVARGQDAIVRLTPKTFVNPWYRRIHTVQIEEAKVVMQPEGTDTQLFLAMERSGSGWARLVPSTLMGETGFRFHVEYANGAFVAVDPPGAPVDSLFWIEVDPPATMTTFVQSDVAFLVDNEVNVFVAMTPGTFFVNGTLYYRQAGRSSYFRRDFVLDPELQLPHATIHSTAVTSRGVEYWAEVETPSRGLTDPPSNPMETPRIIQTRIPEIREGQSWQGERYRLLSFPLDVGQEVYLENILSDVHGLGPKADGNWRAFMNQPRGSYTEFTPSTAAQFRVEPGRSFWFISRGDHRIDTRSVEARSTPSQPAFAIVLQPGWSAFGNPFDFDVPWDSVRSSLELDPPVGFDPSQGSRGDYRSADPVTLEPFDGYLIENTSTQPETLWIPAIEFTGTTIAEAGSNKVRSSAAGSTQEGEWSLEVQAASETAFDGANVLGIHPEAKEGHDALDRRKPPAPPGEWIRLAFVHRDWAAMSGEYRRDLRMIQEEGQTWDLELTTQRREDPVGISVRGGEFLPEGLVLRLVDRELRVDVEPTPNLEISKYEVLSFGSNVPYRLSILVGSADYVSRESASLTGVPSALLLDPARPNPFNGRTRIRFGITRDSARVEIRIYDARGRLVAIPLPAQQLVAGYHGLIWDGTDMQGNLVASGVYFCRLSDGANDTVRSITLLK